MRIIALTNDGQLPMMKSMLNSAFKAGVDMSLFTCYRLHSQREVAYYQTAQFRNLTITKLEVIYHALRKYEEILWVDNDIVFFENMIPDILKFKEMMVMQDDIWSPCTGFFLIRKNDITMKLIRDCINWLKVNYLNSLVNDQMAFNQLYTKAIGLSLTLLPRDEYPNGHVYFNELIRDKAKMVHCNYVTNTFDKIARLKEYRMWNESDEGISKVEVEFFDQNEFVSYK